MVNTINNIAYNLAQREKLNAAYIASKQALNAYLDCDEDNNEVYNNTCDALQKACDFAYLRCFAAQFPVCRNEWFLGVVEGMPEETKITVKQYDAFMRYVKTEDANSYKINAKYCRAGQYLITITNHGKFGGWFKKQYIGKF